MLAHTLFNTGGGAEVLARADQAYWRDLVGERAGAYRLQSLIGSGGMSVVYRGIRADGTIDREVAIKFLCSVHPSEQLLIEARAVAALRHPNIISLLDVGRWADGTPFLVLELVQGQDLQTYLQQQRPNLQQRLTLWLRICDAVAAAHASFVAHRDIKPGNILIDGQEQPRLLDFGIASSFDSDPDRNRPDLGLGLGTPHFGAPEALAGDALANPALADQFGLGVLLMDMLLPGRQQRLEPPSANCFPRLHLGLPANLRDWAAQLQISARRMRRAYRCGLGDIIERATRRDPRDRYESVAALAADMRAWQTLRPLTARPRGKSYVIGKWLLRNRWPLAAGGLALAAAIGFTVNTVLVNRRTQAALVQVEQAQNRAESVNEFLLQLLTSAHPDENGSGEITLLEAVRRTEPLLHGYLVEQPGVESRIRRILGASYRALGQFELARGMLEQAQALNMQLPVDLSERRKTQIELGLLLEETGAITEASELYEAALNNPPQPALSADWIAVRAADALAAALARQGQLDLAREWYRAAEPVVATLTATPDDLSNQSSAAIHWADASRLHYLLGDLEQSVALADQALALASRAFGETSVAVAKVLVQRAQAQFQIGDYASATASASRAREQFTELLGPDHPRVADAAYIQAQPLMVQGHLREAEALYLQALAIRRAATGPSHPEAARLLTVLALVYFDQRRVEELEKVSAEAEQILREAYGEHNALTLQVRQLWAHALALRGDWETAEQIHQAAIAQIVIDHGADNFRVAYLRRQYARHLLWLRHRPDLALPELIESMRILQPMVHPGDFALNEVRSMLGDALHQLGRDREALDYLRATQIEGAELVASSHRMCVLLAEPMIATEQSLGHSQQVEQWQQRLRNCPAAQ